MALMAEIIAVSTALELTCLHCGVTMSEFPLCSGVSMFSVFI